MEYEWNECGSFSLHLPFSLWYGVAFVVAPAFCYAYMVWLLIYAPAFSNLNHTRNQPLFRKENKDENSKKRTTPIWLGLCTIRNLFRPWRLAHDESEYGSRTVGKISGLSFQWVFKHPKRSSYVTCASNLIRATSGFRIGLESNSTRKRNRLTQEFDSNSD